MNNQAAQTMPLPPSLPEWSRMDNLGGVVPSEVRQALIAMYQQGYAAALSQTAGVPDGYAVVPIEPTGDMLDAILAPWLIGTKTQRECLTEGYRAMIVAAQRNDYDSRCDTRDTYGAQPGSPEFDGADAFERYLRQTTQAAPAASGVNPDALPDGTLSKSTAKRVTALAAASVSERARTASLNEIVPAEKRNYLDDNGNPRSIEDEAYAHGWNACRAAAIRTLEQALTQQRGSASYNAGMAMHWIERYAAGIDEECQLDRIAEAFTTPHPSADAVREDSARLDWIESQIREYGDGYTEPREAGWGIQWQQERPDHYWPGLRAWIDEERRRTSADELESLLSAASGEGVGK